MRRRALGPCEGPLARLPLFRNAATRVELPVPAALGHQLLVVSARGARLVTHRKETAARRIVVGTHSGIEALGLAPVLRALAASEPDLVPDVRMGPHSVLLDKLEGGSLDALLEFRDPSGAPAASTVFRRLGDAPVVCYCAPDHPFAAAGTVSLDELASAGKVAICNPYTADAAIDALQRQVVGYVGPDNAIMCANVEAATTLAATGIAYVVVPCIPDLSKMGLVAVPLGGVDPLVFGVRVRRGRMTHALSAFVRALGTYVDEVANG